MARILCFGVDVRLPDPASFADRLRWQGTDWAVLDAADLRLRIALRDRDIRVFLAVGPITDRLDLVDQVDRVVDLIATLAPDGIAVRLSHTDLDAEVAANLQAAAESVCPGIEMLLIGEHTPDFAALDEFADHYAIPGATEGTRARTLRTVLTFAPEQGMDVDGVFVPA